MPPLRVLTDKEPPHGACILPHSLLLTLSAHSLPFTQTFSQNPGPVCSSPKLTFQLSVNKAPDGGSQHQSVSNQPLCSIIRKKEEKSQLSPFTKHQWLFNPHSKTEATWWAKGRAVTTHRPPTPELVFFSLLDSLAST